VSHVLIIFQVETEVMLGYIGTNNLLIVSIVQNVYFRIEPLPVININNAFLNEKSLDDY